MELAKKDNIFKSQRRLIAELQAEYKFKLDRRNEKYLQPEPKAKTPQSKEPWDTILRMKATNASVFQTPSCNPRPAQQGNKTAFQHGTPDPQPFTSQLTANNAPTSNQHQLAQPTTGKSQDIPDVKSTSNQQCPANSTPTAHLGLHIQGNTNNEEISSKKVFQYGRTDHNIERSNTNYGKLKPGAMMVTEEGEHLTLVKQTKTGWNTINIHTKEQKNLENVEDMARMQYIGMLSSQTEEGDNLINYDDQLVFVERGVYKKKLFVTAQINYHKESVFVEYIPRSQNYLKYTR